MFSRWRSYFLAALLFSWTAAVHAAPRYLTGYPEQIPVCAVHEDIQTCIDKNNQVRLLNADYSLQDSRRLYLKTGQQIYGLTRTRLPAITVTPGSHDVVLSHVYTPEVLFAPGGLYFENLLYDVHGRIQASHSRLANSVFIRIDGQLLFDDSEGGFAANNVFIACHANSVSPLLVLSGSTDFDSSFNNFLGLILQGQVGSATMIDHQGHILLMGTEAENWNHLYRDKKFQAALDIRQSGEVSIIGSDFGANNAYATPFLSYEGGGHLQLSNINGHVQRSLAATPTHRSAWSTEDLNSIHINGQVKLTSDHVQIPINYNGTFTASPSISEQVVRNQISTPDFDNFRKAFWLRRSEDKRVFPQRPELTRPPADIQHLIDQSPDHIAMLPAGTFIVSRPIVIPPGGGLVGAGSARTTIIGSGVKTLVTVQVRSNDTSMQSRFILSNLALADAAVGVTVTGENFGATHIVVREPIISDIRISNMSEAGILIEGLQGWDNVMLDNVNFQNDSIGVKQTYRAAKAGDDGLLNYVDKTGCIFCSFDRVRWGIALTAGRQDNQNSCLFCTFNRYSAAALSLNNNSDYILFLPIFFGKTKSAVDIESQGSASLSTSNNVVQHPTAGLFTLSMSYSVDKSLF